jgi:predicted dehydrogenase
MHARTLSRLDPSLTRFWASRDPDRARQHLREHGGGGSFGGYRDALADARVQVALVLTPPSSHLEWTLAALEAGKHVIVEKPAFRTPAEFDRVAVAAAAAGLQVLVAENYHYKPLAKALRRVLAEERLGRLLFLQVNALKTQKAEGWRTDPGLAGGGALFEGGVHWISLLAHLGPEVRRVSAVIPRGRAPEKSVALVLEYEGGALGTLSYSWEVPARLGGLRISKLYGSEGSATFESNGLFLAMGGRRPWIHVPGLRDLLGYRGMFRDFLSALRTGRPPDFRLEDARRDVELIEEAYRSAGTGL